MCIAYRAPFDRPALVAFLSKRTIAPVEVFEGDEYVREGMRIRHDRKERSLIVRSEAGSSTGRPVKRPASTLFDTDADSGEDRVKTEKALLRMAEGWRPWRAYAAMRLWNR